MFIINIRKTNPMGGNSLKLKILWWTEVIISARALMFFVPVLIDTYLTKGFVPGLLDHLFMVVAAFAALFYLFIGFISLLGHKLWRLFHFVGVLVVASLTAGLCHVVRQARMPVKFIYFVPVILAVMIIAGIIWGQGRSRPA